MALKRRLRRIERAAEGELITIPQQDGTVARFPRSAYREAFLNAVDRIRLRGTDERPPRHPLLDAARSSSDPRWRVSYFSDIDDPAEDEGDGEPVPDLSE
ncbi:MAG: hypothetical protein M3N18_13070 [Actinomycetota bacterium]|nr:hypothetical protein [Actinomycetota bacterium]